MRSVCRTWYGCGEMGKDRFDYFVILAGMRTGSNLLEEHLSAIPGLTSYGEMFNPHFFGSPGQESLFGLSLAARDDNPLKAVAEMCREATGLPGFRLFYDHDPRVIDHVLADQRAAKVVLSRRPLDSYVSLKIARKTGKWWASDMAKAAPAKVTFDAEEYSEFLTTLSEFDLRIRHALQTTGQTAFHISYSDLSDADVIAGLGRYLGNDGQPDPSKVKARVQNPTPVTGRLENPEEAERALLALSVPDLGYLPSYEPDRGPGLRLFHASTVVPLLYMPIRGAGRDVVPEWLASIGEVESGMNQKEARRWMRLNPKHRSFTVLRHPLPRAYDAFCRFILPAGVEPYADIRDALISRYGVPLPDETAGKDWALEDQRAAFLGFLDFLVGNLGGQTPVRVDNTWASQFTLLEAIARFKVPDRVVREETLRSELSDLVTSIGNFDVPKLQAPESRSEPFALGHVQTADIDEACEKAYRRDFLFFGYGRWRGAGQAA